MDKGTFMLPIFGSKDSWETEGKRGRKKGKRRVKFKANLGEVLLRFWGGIKRMGVQKILNFSSPLGCYFRVRIKGEKQEKFRV